MERSVCTDKRLEMRELAFDFWGCVVCDLLGLRLMQLAGKAMTYLLNYSFYKVDITELIRQKLQQCTDRLARIILCTS